MEKVENTATPRIEIFCSDPQAELLAGMVGYGIEEEGLPYRISTGEYHWTEVYEACHSPGLGVAILVREGEVSVFTRQLQEKKPLFDFPVWDGEWERAKTIGKNAARIIKNKPFLEFVDEDKNGLNRMEQEESSMFTLNSSGISNGYILDDYGINSDRVIQGVPQRSLPYEWEGAPEGTESFAIVFQDYDNVPDEGFSWIHWLVADIPAEVKSLKENASREDGSLIQGTNSWSIPYGPYENIDQDLTLHYGGPAPERRHEYETKIYALDYLIGLKPGFYYNELLRAMEGHILAEATLKGYYG